MAPRNRPLQAIAASISELTVEVRHLRMLFYFGLSLLIILCILVILSLTYADSYNPLALFSTSDRLFSFSGSPLSVMMHSKSDNYLYADMIDNGTVYVQGQSAITLNPVSPVLMISESGDRRTVDGPMFITTSAGIASLMVSQPAGVSQSYNNTHLYFSEANVSYDNRGQNYNLRFSSGPGTVKSYDNEFIAIGGGLPLYTFMNYLRLSDGNFTVTDLNGTYEFRGDILYPGTISLATPDYLSTFLPISETENPISVDELDVMNTAGSLVIGGKEYQCHGADNMIMTSDNDAILSMIRMGKVQAVGRVDSLTFRNEEYATQPIKNFMRDGYFTMVTGILTALFALFSRQFLAEFRRR